MCPVGVSFFVESNLTVVHSYVAWCPANTIKVLCSISGCCYYGTDLVFIARPPYKYLNVQSDKKS